MAAGVMLTMVMSFEETVARAAATLALKAAAKALYSGDVVLPRDAAVTPWTLCATCTRFTVALGADDGTDDRIAVGLSVGSCVGGGTGIAVGVLDGAMVGVGVGVLVGDCVGGEVGDSLGLAVGTGVGNCVGSCEVDVATNVDADEGTAEDTGIATGEEAGREVDDCDRHCGAHKATKRTIWSATAPTDLHLHRISVSSYTSTMASSSPRRHATATPGTGDL